MMEDEKQPEQHASVPPTPIPPEGYDEERRRKRERFGQFTMGFFGTFACYVVLGTSGLIITLVSGKDTSLYLPIIIMLATVVLLCMSLIFRNGPRRYYGNGILAFYGVALLIGLLLLIGTCMSLP